MSLQMVATMDRGLPCSLDRGPMMHRITLVADELLV